MKHIVERHTFAEVNEICKKYGISDWSINSNGLVDVNWDVFIDARKDSSKNMTEIPLNFGKVSRSFAILGTDITSLKGCPYEVGSDFEVSHNKLTSLAHGPKVVGRGYSCADNQITSLRYAPKIIKGDFFCHQNKIKNLLYAPKVEGRFVCFDNDFPIELQAIADAKDYEKIRKILEHQDEYSIWNKLGKLNKYRLRSLLEDN